MMDFLKEWTFCVCVSLIISVIFSLFSPSTKMNRFYKMLISVFVFLSFIYPLKDMNISDINLSNTTSQTQTLNAKPYEDMLKSSVEKVLENAGITDFEVNCKASVNSSNEIEIESVTVKIPKDYSKQNVKDLIKTDLEINAKVKYFGE